MTFQKQIPFPSYFLGLVCLLLAGVLWFMREHVETKATSRFEKSIKSVNDRKHGEKTARSRNRKTRNLPSADGAQTALYNYMNDARYGLTRTGVQKVIDQVKSSFPIGDYPEPSTIKNMRRFRDQQISVLIACLSDSLSLSSTQRTQLKHELVARANADFANFSGKLSKPFEHDGVQYTIVHGGAMQNLYRPANWLQETKIQKLCPLNAQQTSILWTEDIPHMPGFYKSPYAVSSIMRDPSTGTISGHPQGSAPNCQLTVNLLPLTPDQGHAMRELEPANSKNAQLLKQSLILTRAQLTLSLLLRPKHLESLQQALSE